MYRSDLPAFVSHYRKPNFIISEIKVSNMDFDTLFRYHYRPLCLYAIHYVHDIDAAEDVVQECFSVLWEKRNRKAGDS